MKFTAFKEFKIKSDTSLKDIVAYFGSDYRVLLRDLQLGLTKLSFGDNFESFEVEVSIPATTELAIQNRLTSGLIPTKRVIVRGGDGTQNIVDGDTPWSSNFVYLKNVGATDVSFTVVFFRS